MGNWQEIDNERKKYIRMGERLFGGTFTDIRRSLFDELKNIDRIEQIEGVVESFKFDANLWDAYEKFYTRTAPDFAERTVRRHKKSRKDIDLYIEEVLEFVRVNSGDKITKIIKTHYDDIVRIAKAAVEKGIDEGLGFDQVARIIRREQGDIDSWKALRIARTETVAASNYGVELGAEQLPGTKRKVWISSFTPTSREDHMEMDGVQIGLGESFRLSDGTNLRFPGDPEGPADQIINCRCAEEVIIIDEIY